MVEIFLDTFQDSERNAVQAHICLETIFVFLFCRMDFFFFFFFWLHWVFAAARGVSLVAASGGYSSLRCAVFSLWWLLLLRNMGSRRAGFSSCGSHAAEHRLSSCGARAQLLRGMWALPGPGLEPVSPALAGGFLTTAPPGKSLKQFLVFKNSHMLKNRSLNQLTF